MIIEIEDETRAMFLFVRDEKLPPPWSGGFEGFLRDTWHLPEAFVQDIVAAPPLTKKQRRALSKIWKKLSPAEKREVLQPSAALVESAVKIEVEEVKP